MKKIISVCLCMTMLFSLAVPCFAAGAVDFCVEKSEEQNIRIVVPENWEMDIGDSRSVDCVFTDGITDRVITWSVEPKENASVDMWGRVTALKEGKVTVTATTNDGFSDSAVLNVVSAPTMIENRENTKRDYSGEATKENDVLQKLVSRYEYGSKAVSEEYYNKDSYSDAQIAYTADGAKWEITSYGVLRTDPDASNERDKEMRFMGDRYFFSEDTTTGKVLAIFADGKNGIWTVMEEGFTHIEMVEMDGTDKAALMSEDTQKYVARRGMVSDADYIEGYGWKPCESDNDGLWTSMYGAGELMRYAVLRDDPTATEEEIEEARKTAYQSTEAVLLLTYISMRTGTTESLVHAQRNGSVNTPEKGKWYGEEALIEGGDYSQAVPALSPTDAFSNMMKSYMTFGKRTYIMKEDNLSLMSPEDWKNANTEKDTEYAKRTRLVEGFWARTYSLTEENNDVGGYIHWKHNGDGTATGVSTKPETASGYLLNGENLRGVTVDASGEIPERLWNDLIGSGYEISDITYKGDTSADEIIGHLFIYKLAYDILGAEDPEIASLIQRTMDSFAQHIVDNGYALCDGSGQPTTWGKFSRTYFHNGQVLGGVPLQASVCLNVFKTAAYVTGYQKWENEYRMAALDPAYEYAEALTQEWERYQMCMFEYINSVSPVLGFILRPLAKTELFRVLYRLILNYSDEEMAMLSYYLLFQMEDDETLLKYYRDALDDWWYSMSFSENPLWYYIYQLAYPDEDKADQYGNSLKETAAWSLSRHPIDTRCYLASNDNRDDIGEINLSRLGIGGTEELSFDLQAKKPLFWSSDNNILKIIGIVLSATHLQWKVASPDERALHKYNGATYRLGQTSNANFMEGSTTYTLPYWLGRYHGLIN
ncbi:MAG: Ig-like domain-containing protein [Acutalibacteraceae bacterium]